MFYSLPPVRRAIPLSRGKPSYRLEMEQYFARRPITLYASGTAALCRALSECAALSSVSVPEVILPAYGCPDLVAASLRASTYPRLVDLAPSGWGYDLEMLESALSGNTVAVVAVNLLGVGDGFSEIYDRCLQKRVPVIQDSAQFLPRFHTEWPGEYVVLSFGRGKPLNLLHGGALVGPRNAHGTLPPPPARNPWRDRALATRAAALSFNALTHPALYWAVSALPGVTLGKVAYEPLRNCDSVPERAWKQVGQAFKLYLPHQSYRRAIWETALLEWSKLGIRPLECSGSPPDPEPLRLALLAPNRGVRDGLVSELSRRGLGPSLMYGTTLNRVAGIPEIVRRQGPFPNATSLSERLFTLPTHNLVVVSTVDSARDAVMSWHGRTKGNL